MRKDLSVYNEATGFSIHGAGFAGHAREDVAEDTLKYVKEGVVIPIELVQDDGFVARVVLGDLTEQEEEEWVGKIEWKLKVPCGKLTVEGGLDPDSEDDGDFTESVQIPPGDYRVEVYTYLFSINGDYCLDAAGNKEPIGEWFRRTRPGLEPTDGLKLLFCDDPEQDPGHEDEWDEFDSDDVETCQVDFVIRLTPLQGPDPELKVGEEGWFDIDVNARKPELCPLGILAELDEEEDDDEDEDDDD